MEKIILTKERYYALWKMLEELRVKMEQQHHHHTEKQFCDNQEFIRMMGISKRLAQTWRSQGKIPYMQIGNKIYYKLSDVAAFIQEHYVRPH